MINNSVYSNRQNYGENRFTELISKCDFWNFIGFKSQTSKLTCPNPMLCDDKRNVKLTDYCNRNGVYYFKQSYNESFM